MADASQIAPLAISLGDPAGIGPEIIAAAWHGHGPALWNECPFFVVGGKPTLDAAFARLPGGEVPRTFAIADPSQASGITGDALPVLDLGDQAFAPGMPSEAGAALALQSLAEATRFALLGSASGVVTAPVAKSQLAKVGFEYPGQTEFLAAACGMGPDDVVMMLAGPSLRTVPLTIHVALADVPACLTQELIVGKAAIVDEALRKRFGIEHPRIAITGLNPHAGEDGKFGSEERDVIEPAISALQDRGMDVRGPLAADTLFAPHKRASFDVALCMYHDQALIPIKALDFDQGVNCTLGLPIIRTSPDHGTAFDIAGKGIAEPGAMIAAIRMAGEMARQTARG